jgi:predicted enzyme related to lactoylglutathione lyase
MPVNLGWPCWIGVVAEDLAAQRRFYGDVLGLTELDAHPDWVHFDLGRGKLFELVQRSNDPQYDRVRYQVGYAVDDIKSTRDELIAHGVEPVSEIEGNAQAGGRWCYFRDPEANIFEIKEGPREGRGLPTNLGWPCWIGVVAEDLAAQRQFYRDVLGLAELSAHPEWVHFDMGEEKLFELVKRNDEPQYDRKRYQVAFAVEAIQSTRENLVARGVPPISGIRGTARAGGRWCYFRDPEGNVFAIKECPPAGRRLD